MIGRVIHLDQVRGHEAAALVVDGQLQDLLIAPAEDTILPGAIFRAIVDRPVKGQGGVFVRLPDGSGFLRQASGLAPGQRVLVQVSGTAEAGKAIPVTTRLLFKSRFCIVTPGAPGLNVSRRIRDEALREELTALALAGMAGSEDGLILRSACEHAGDEAIAEDIAATRALAEAVLADVNGDPELLVDGPSPHEAAWRDWSDEEPDEVTEGAFAEHGVLEMIDAVLDATVPLAAGGSMVIETTRALVAVDVNTGPDTSPAAGMKANVAVARDLPRQLRLRGLGGQIVVDFAPMSKKDRATLDQVLRAAFKAEPSETSLVGWTAMGLYEIVRKRDRLPLTEALA
ncbi:ribonuclease E/G [Falsirhodobacter sp. 20TX0035]|uniref:ribonuclease E/G n=1 Tax=Falsirhodobacter sp. 20TX0035 TaxID=3022019 RepID=UPI00232E0CF4|nr:ribonuclease E/G [Falsirhodobacter sp. 20TX0035]MDB6454875.1 ribonuclease E/G [Falsirhodobacter sp. 20TX0035]